MSRQMSIFKMADEQAIKGKRVLISILSNLYKYGQLKKHVYFNIFDTKIVPILCYGSELWGSIEHKSIETVHNYAC